MRERALIHVAGPAGAGKTTFVERLLGAEVSLALCVRTERDPKLRNAQESAPRSHAELCRYRAAGASDVALYRFPRPDWEAFYTSRVLEEYSEAVFIEGDRPVDDVDLSVFVAPPLPAGRSLLRRVVRDHRAERRSSIEQLARALEEPEAMLQLLGAGLSEPLLAMAITNPKVEADIRRTLKQKLSAMRHAPPPPPTEHWSLEDGYAGLAHAQLVVVNLRGEAERQAAAALVEDVGRLRKDEAVFHDVLGFRGSKVPVTAVVADLSNPKDPGLKKAIARVRRTVRSPG